MNTGHKPTKVLLCVKCRDMYMMVGDTPIQLAFPRKPTINSVMGGAHVGTCPKHNRPKGL